MRHAPLTMTDT